MAAEDKANWFLEKSKEVTKFAITMVRGLLLTLTILIHFSGVDREMLMILGILWKVKMK